jgi:choline dehydrogenase-like flavoprotein
VLSFYGRIGHSPGTLSLTNKIARSHQFYDRFRKDGLGSALFVSRQAWVLPHHVMPFKVRNIPRNLLSFASRAVKATLFIGASTEMSISDSNRVTLSKSQVDAFGNPLAHLAFNFSEEDVRLLDSCRTLIREMYRKLGGTRVYEAEVSWGRHHQGTCRMGDNPQASVVDRNLRIHEAPNVYVCGSEVFVTGGAMPPCLTITALAHRLADHLVVRLREG